MTPEQCLSFLSERLPANCALPVIAFEGDPYGVDRSAWWSRVWRGGRLNRNANLFVGISAFECLGNVPQGAFLPRRKEFFVCTTAIMVDDIGTKIPVSAMKLEPTWLVETSEGNYQAWYALEQPCFDADRVAGFIAALIDAGLCLKADPGMSGVSRVGRLPGGLNAKAKYCGELDEGGFRVRITRAGLRRFTLEEIAVAYGIPPASAPREHVAVQLEDGLLAMTPEAEIMLLVLEEEGMVLGRAGQDGGYPILCPWVETHTDRADTGTVYFLPQEKNGWLGGFKCHHGHCAKRTIGSLLRWGETIIEGYEREQKWSIR